MGVWVVVGASAAWSSVTRDFNGGVYLYQRGDYELAARTFEAILAKHPGIARTDEVLFWYGQSIGQIGRQMESLSVFQKLIAEHPESKLLTKARYAAGQTCARLDQYEDAAVYLTAVLADPATAKDKSLSVDCRILIADCYLKSGKDKLAEQALRDGLAIPKLPADKKLEAEFALARLLLRNGRPQEAAPLMTRVAQHAGPRQAEAFMSLGDLAYSDGKYLRSLEWYEKVIRSTREIQPGVRTRAVYNGAWSYLALGEIDKSLVLFSEVLDDQTAPPDVRGDAALRMAQILREKGKRTSSDEYAALALKLSEENRAQKLMDEVLFFRSQWAFQDRQYDPSRAYLERVRERGYRVYRLAGQISYETGRLREAVAFFDSAVKLAPGRDAVNLCHLDLAQSLFVSKSFDSALATLDRIKQPSAELLIRFRPFKADVLFQVGRVKEAGRQYEKLAEESVAWDTPAGQRYRYFAALSYVQANHITSAAKILDLFAQTLAGSGSAPADSIIAAGLLLQADILVMQKKYSAALPAYTRAIDAASPFGPESLYLAYSHLIDFASTHAKDRLWEFSQSFLSALPEVRSYRIVSNRLFEAGQYPSLLACATDMLDRVEADDELRGKALYYQMMAQHKLGDLPSATDRHEALDQWLALHPSTALSDESDFWGARLAKDSKNWPAAARAYQAYLEKHAGGQYVTESRFELGLIALETRQPDTAEREFLRLLEGKSETDIATTPALSDIRYNLASVHIQQGRFADAAGLLESLLALNSYKSDPACLYKLGYVYSSLQRDTEAETLFRRAIAQKSAPPGGADNAIAALLSLLYRTERYKDLEDEFRRSSARIQDRVILARSRFLLGMTLFDADRLTEAGAYFKTVRQMEAGDTDLDIESAIRLADCLFNLRRFDAALEEYQWVTDRFMNSKWGLEALYSSGLCKSRLGMAVEALEGFERFLRDRPDEPLAIDVAREAARTYLGRGDLERAEEKLDFLENRKASGLALEELRRFRVMVWQKRGKAEKVIELAAAYRAAHGLNADVSLAAAEAAIQLGRYAQAAAALWGFDDTQVDARTRSSILFYRAEALRLQNDTTAMDLYHKLVDSQDSEIRLASRYRLGLFLLDRQEFSKARGMLVSAVSDAADRQTPFFQDAVRQAFRAAKLAQQPREVVRLNDLFASELTAEPDRRAAAEYNLWAHLALKDTDATLDAADRILSFRIDPRRRAEVRIIQAQIHETMGDPDRADDALSDALKQSDAPEDIRAAAEMKKIKMAIDRGESGRAILETHLRQGARGGAGAARAAESLLSSAIRENRHADIVRIVRLMQDKLAALPTAADYARALAHAALGDTPASIDHLRRIADDSSADSYYVAWSAYRAAQEDVSARKFARARPYLQTAWRLRDNLGQGSGAVYRQLVSALHELGDAPALRSLAADSPPEKIPDGSGLASGLAAWLEKDYAGAARHLSGIAQPEPLIRWIAAESLKLSADTPGAIRAYERLSEEEGEPAAKAAIEAAALYASVGRIPDGLIACYKVLAEYESDTASEMAPDALLAICKLYLQAKDTVKFREAADELVAKFPKSRQAKEAAKLAGRVAIGLRQERK